MTCFGNGTNNRQWIQRKATYGLCCWPLWLAEPWFTVRKQATRSCNVTAAHRAPCGWHDISVSDCYNIGCCTDQFASCYLSNGESRLFVVVRHSNSVSVISWYYMMYEMRWRKSERTLLSTQGIFNFTHHIGFCVLATSLSICVYIYIFVRREWAAIFVCGRWVDSYSVCAM